MKFNLLFVVLEYQPLLHEYSFYSKYQQVVVSPIVDEFTNCTIIPSLPEGLSIDSTTCIVSGKVNTAMSSTSYLVTSTMMGKTFTGSFQLRIDECLGTYVEIRRDYKANAADEMYSLIDTLTNQVILTDTHQVDGISHSDYKCLTRTEYKCQVLKIVGHLVLTFMFLLSSMMMKKRLFFVLIMIQS